MMVITSEGAATGPDGLSGSLSGPADRLALLETRRLADKIIVGAETIRAERYKPIIAKPEWTTARSSAGLASAPILIIVSRGLNLPWDDPLFKSFEHQVIIATVNSVAREKLATAKRLAKVVIFGDSEVNLTHLLRSLQNQGLRRIVCEGGPTLIEGLCKKNLIDEMNFTISPLHPGSGEPEQNLRVALDFLRKKYPNFRFANQITKDNFVFCRLLRVRTQP